MKRRLVLIPGLLCDPLVWERQAAQLEHLAAPWISNPGTLDSLGAMAEAILAAVPGPFCVAGHSMGGRVALEILRRAPERVQRLALLDTGHRARPAGPSGELETAGRARLVEIARTHGMRALGREWLPKMLHPDRLADESLFGALLEMVGRCPLAQYEAQIRALLERPDASEVARLTRCPTLVLCGRDDAWSPLEQHRELAALIAGSRLVAIEQCGHMSTVERPEAVTGALSEWLTSDPAW